MEQIMDNFYNYLQSITGKMLAVYRQEKMPLKPFMTDIRFLCKTLSYTVNGDVVELYDTYSPEKGRFTLDISLLVSIKTKRKDKHGAMACRLYMQDNEYVFVAA
jgi:hypothetical protein